MRRRRSMRRKKRRRKRRSKLVGVWIVCVKFLRVYHIFTPLAAMFSTTPYLKSDTLITAFISVPTPWFHL